MEYRHHPVVSQTGPDFAAALPPNGYAWWYVDALSDCGRYGLTVIAMLGCVFSPWYARARRRGLVDPLQHSALNVVLYRGSGRRWAMTERDAEAVTRNPDQLTIGTSRVLWDGNALQIEVERKNLTLAPTTSRSYPRDTAGSTCHALSARCGWPSSLVADGTDCSSRSAIRCASSRVGRFSLSRCEPRSRTTRRGF